MENDFDYNIAIHLQQFPIPIPMHVRVVMYRTTVSCYYFENLFNCSYIFPYYSKEFVVLSIFKHSGDSHYYFLRHFFEYKPLIMKLRLIINLDFYSTLKNNLLHFVDVDYQLRDAENSSEECMLLGLSVDSVIGGDD